MKSENKDFNTSYDAFSKDYNKIGSLDYSEKEKQPPKKPTGLRRKYHRIKQAFERFWAVGKTGFQLGACAGGALGFVLGAYESIRIKSFLPLPLAIIGTGFSFGFIFAISTVVRSNPNNSEEYVLETVYFDKQTNKFYKKTIPLNEKYLDQMADIKYRY